ncbi:MAG: class I SAM-dependent methyltransferase [Candidatus Korarchaeota archaeon]|nr:class I SAM-dependent methyltransferase [Candidatus Korarchaeota archaeon]NIU82231.1 methyltransferase domain-containing protein [Candidatus Thorarchaeota archaeon]NIW12694.1 methyltransferase domain-containing protein [Candidatus Thorarchaeota archaeon]NIW50901.1 methyltransferase domain-containing protein [Candidatus Korarchaeota archaeon]
MSKIGPFEEHPLRYEAWFEKHKFVYQAELRAVRALLPESGDGIEIGVGTGRFAGPLGIKMGVDPSRKMRAQARKKGIMVIDAVAEDLPFKDQRFDYALMVTTLCFLDDVDQAFGEIYRILKPRGCFINGFIDRESPVGRTYQKHKRNNVFYRIAEFYSVDEVVAHLQKAGFKDFEYTQTIFQSLPNTGELEPVRPGFGQGSFVVVKGKK